MSPTGAAAIKTFVAKAEVTINCEAGFMFDTGVNSSPVVGTSAVGFKFIVQYRISPVVSPIKAQDVCVRSGRLEV